MKLGQGYVFTSVCDSVHRGGASAPLHAGITPQDQALPPWPGTPLGPDPPPPGPGTPPVQTSPGADTHPKSRHPPEQTPPEQTAPPPSSACWEIRATSGRYASYWNEIFFHNSIYKVVWYHFTCHVTSDFWPCLHTYVSINIVKALFSCQSHFLTNTYQ